MESLFTMNTTSSLKPYFAPGWKKSALGTPIDLYASAPLASLRGLKPILLMGGIHGDEPEGVRLAKDTLKWLQSAMSQGETLTPWVCVPCLNVDGFAKRTRVNGRGVDLNRNYPSKDWSPEASKERYYPGPSPGSEPEIQAVVELIALIEPRLIIHCHSWEPCIVLTGDPGQKDADRLGQASGYKVMGEIGYPTPGGLSRYGWHDKGIPIICIEESDKFGDSDEIWPRFAPAMKEIFTDLSMRTSAENASPIKRNSNG